LQISCLPLRYVFSTIRKGLEPFGIYEESKCKKCCHIWQKLHKLVMQLFEKLS
jgi:hypothetical protein